MNSKWTRPILTGLLGSLVMFVITMFAIHGAGMAPFNVTPSAAFFAKLGLPMKPLALIAHFGYGAFWSVVLVAIFKNSVSLGKGISLALVLWLIMMVVYSPIIGWGLFGLSGSSPSVASDAPLYLQAGPKYLVATLVLHLVYGSIIGGLNAKWSVKDQ